MENDLNVITSNRKYKTLVTDIGNIKQANAVLNGGKVNIVTAVIGDGGGAYYVPVPSQTALRHEVWRGDIANKEINEKSHNMYDVRIVLDGYTGPFTVREVGLLDNEGDLIVIANTPDTPKAILPDGILAPLTIILHVVFASVDVVNFTVNPSVDSVDSEMMQKAFQKHDTDPNAHVSLYQLANGKWTAVDATTGQKGIVQLSSATNSTSEALAATPKAVKSAYDLANGKLSATGTAVAASKLATARTIQTNLASTSAVNFDGSANVSPGVTGILPFGNGGTGNNSGYIRAGQKAETAIGDYATAEGYITTASGAYSHAEGYSTTASEWTSHAEGYSTTASDSYSHAEGYKTTASVWASHAEGIETTANEWASHAEGVHTTANNYASHACGKYSKEMADGATNHTNNGDVMVIGNGNYYSNGNILSNAFRVTYAGAVYGTSAFNSTGADYAEYFEWVDGNPDKEDRAGYFVTMDGVKIRKAKPGEYILGIVSGQPCIIGNADEDWLGRWKHDKFGRFVKEYLEDTGEKDENGNPVEKIVDHETQSWRYAANPDYDSTQKYVERKDRPEWSAVGMLGVLSVYDDGTCQTNGYCQVDEGGTATAAEQYIPGLTYRVMERITNDVVKIVFRGA